jgi:hypothetical protein
MEHHHRDLIARLFVTATELAEAAHDIGVAGQSPSLVQRKMITLAAALRGRAGDLAAIADAIAAVVGREDSKAERTPRRTRRSTTGKRRRHNAQGHH